MSKAIAFIGVAVAAVGGILLLGFLMAYPVMWLWNDLTPSLFGFRAITIWEAWQLNILCGWLFKSSTSGCSCKS